MPDEPSQTAVDIVHWFALIAGVIELIAGVVVLAVAWRRGLWR